MSEPFTQLWLELEKGKAEEDDRTLANEVVVEIAGAGSCIVDDLVLTSQPTC